MKKVTAAVIFKDRSVLITRRKEGETLSGFWEFPGGKLHRGETPQSCLERELREELGITAKAGKILATSEHRYDHGVFQIIAIQTEILGGEIRLTVHDRAEWVPIDELMEYRLASADVSIARRLFEVCDEL
jgi:8-oxo-dGTP diphosphatase